MTRQNLFCKLNLHAFDENGQPDLALFKPITGNLGGFVNLDIEFLADNTIELNRINNARDRKSSGEY